MAKGNYQVIFSGQAMPGVSIEQLKTNIAVLYKTEVQNIESLFSGKTVVIKDQLDEATAVKYADVFRKQGAQCEVRDLAAGQNEPPNSPDMKVQEPASTNTAKAAVIEKPANVYSNPAAREPVKQVVADGVNVASKCTVSVDEYVGSMSSTSLAATGETLVEFKVASVPEINTDALQMASPGETLVDHQEVEEPAISIDSFSLAPTGSDLKN